MAKQRTPEPGAGSTPQTDPGGEGAAPIDVLLGTMRALWQASRDEAGRVVDQKTASTAAGFAKDAAPYVHPRLSSVDAPERDLTRLTDEELEDRIRALLDQRSKED